jgi:UDP-glucuronate decarboxylase
MTEHTYRYWRQHKVRIKVARIFNTYGPRMHPNDGRVVSNFIAQALLGRDISIYRDGSQTRSFCYADDLTDGLMRLMATKDSVTGPVNIVNPTEFTILELAPQIIAMIGSRSRIVTGRCQTTILCCGSQTFRAPRSCSHGHRAHP